jgi:hypothetical protein
MGNGCRIRLRKACHGELPGKVHRMRVVGRHRFIIGFSLVLVYFRLVI